MKHCKYSGKYYLFIEHDLTANVYSKKYAMVLGETLRNNYCIFTYRVKETQSGDFLHLMTPYTVCTRSLGIKITKDKFINDYYDALNKSDLSAMIKAINKEVFDHILLDYEQKYKLDLIRA